MHWIAIVIVIVTVGVFAWWRREKNAPMRTAALAVGAHSFTVEIADTFLLRERGLSGREKLEDQHGMLFIFATAGRHPFWMKDMKLALDFIWIHGDKVVSVTENVPSPKGSLLSLPMYYPPEPADMMLEVNAGTAGRAGIKVGDKVEMVNL